LIGKGRSGVLVSLVERKSHYILLHPVTQRLAEVVAQAIISLLNPFADWVHTITTDNGKEFAEHSLSSDRLKK
jgi:IS30 family transposase